MLGADPLARFAEVALALLDRLPALLEWTQVPAATPSAHDPKPAFVAAKGEPPPDREGLHSFIRAEAGFAMQTR